MTEGQEVRASREQVEEFVGKLKGFHDSLPEAEQAMLGTILQSAQGQDTGGYGYRGYDWKELVGFLTEGDDTQGFRAARGY